MEYEDIERLLEDICPNCEGDVSVVLVSGDRKFLASYIDNANDGDTFRVAVWEHDLLSEEAGQIEYRCETCKRYHKITQLRTGEWS